MIFNKVSFLYDFFLLFQEACNAYQAQNNFLNTEILELHKLRKIDADKLLVATE